MIDYLSLILRLTLWFLLTADLSLPNIVIGLLIAFLLPGSYAPSPPIWAWLKSLWKTICAIPQAYQEAFEIILRPHNEETITMERVKPKRTPGLVFLDIFLITFTPKTIALKYHEEGWYEVHLIQRGKRIQRRKRS